MKTRINVTQLCLDDVERQRKWEEDRRHPLQYYRNRFQWYHYPKWQYIAPFPLHVDFEASSCCNLNCSMCFRRHFDTTDTFGHMDMDLFKRGIDECVSHQLYSIRLSWRGESTLHPQLMEMIRYAKKKGIFEVSFLSNGSALTPEFNRELVSSGLDYITISVDGLPESYNAIRAPLDFDTTVEKIADLYRTREKNGNGYPKIKVQGIYEYFKKGPDTYYETFRPISDNVSFNLKHDYALRDMVQEEALYCPYLWQRITIMSTGIVPLCISDWDGDVLVGDLNQQSIREIWEGKKMQAYRRIHAKNQRLKLPPCKKCVRNHVAKRPDSMRDA